MKRWQCIGQQWPPLQYNTIQWNFYRSTGPYDYILVFGQYLDSTTRILGSVIRVYLNLIKMSLKHCPIFLIFLIQSIHFFSVKIDLHLVTIIIYMENFYICWYCSFLLWRYYCIKSFFFFFFFFFFCTGFTTLQREFWPSQLLSIRSDSALTTFIYLLSSFLNHLSHCLPS